MANVYLAHDIILDREVAIKVLRLEYGNDEEFIARFHREAQSATSLAHPNIVNIYDVGEEDDIYYMVMEYVDGMTLKQYIQQHSPIDVGEALDIIRQITSAISHAHDNNIVHRDIKPQNILIDHYGHVKVTDFGIAMALSATALTQTNSVLGSVHYLSPEQARGGMATKKSDIYSLGIVLFELLTGRLPFSGESPVSIALKHLQHDTPSLKRWISDLPQSVENIVLKATAKDPFHRYGSVMEMEEDLETALDYDRVNEPVFSIPNEEDEEKTKAIPVITEEAFSNQQEEDTIVHTGSYETVSKNEETAEEKEKQTKADKPKKKRKKWPWIVAVISVFLLAGIAALFMIPGIVQPADVKMIDVKGMEYEEAYSKLSELKLKVKRETMYSDTVEDGYVVKTDPEAGMTIKENSEVTVYSSRGKEKVEFKDYTGQDFEKINKELEDKGYQSVFPIEENSDQPEGQIIEQIQPQPGEEVVPEDTRVIFRVSLGPPKVTLRPLEGESEQEAKTYLNNNNLKAEVTEQYSDDVPKGIVISQSPEASSQLEQGATVNLTVSLGKKEEPPRTEKVKVDVPYKKEQNEDPNQDQQDDKKDENPEQKVLIYVNDLDHDISEVFKEESITKDTTIEFEVRVAPDSEATYKVQRGDEVIEEGNVQY
ncbi:Stk1 family PASTA domain-containing Ser/Thr kinase [Halobacillus salinarum]|uniref:Stk1 family PASTA domain-containing Ser/Thr kinase n=1 Tax=Halobacillus salinarum TaxID=2932257 RepID=UPI0029625B7C|nr:Stk1 family PASTA domain-containing Ser/Thr kinase [Halobacillus salinarum]